ncbi:hypothetical protein [Agrobacterium sp. LAD9]|uniref:hypothetical protein n=1 Tax=Agrobacterium sp. LAD9 TaxID=2055153 RepID=UPI000D1EE07C|nr:hypothetical protein [Agrobacterium sp. LAD9]
MEKTLLIRVRAEIDQALVQEFEVTADLRVGLLDGASDGSGREFLADNLPRLLVVVPLHPACPACSIASDEESIGCVLEAEPQQRLRLVELSAHD